VNSGDQRSIDERRDAGRAAIQEDGMRRVFLTSVCLLATTSPAHRVMAGPPPQAAGSAPPATAPAAPLAQRDRPEPAASPQSNPTIEQSAPRQVGAVRGRVRTDGGEPVPGATVADPTTSDAVIAEADGSFVLDGLAPGPHRLQVDAPGYGPVTIVAEVRAGEVTRADIVVAQPVMVGEEIVITGTRTPEKRLDSPINVEWVSEKEIQRAAGGSMMSALAGVKGLDFANACLNDQRISARGFTTQFNSRMLMMQDGRLATLPGNGLPQANLMPATPLDLKSIEVVIGPASALYGPNAHTGVVNVMTKTPWDESGGSLLVRAGNQDMASGAARVAGTIADDLGWKVNAEYMQATDFRPGRRSIVGDDGVPRSPHFYGTDVAPEGMTASPVFEGDLAGGYDIGSVKVDGSLYYKLGREWMAKGTYGFSQSDAFSLTNAGRNHLRDWQVQYQALQLTGPGLYAQVTRTATDAGKSYQLNTLATMVAAMGGVDALTPEQIDQLRDQIRFVDSSQMLDSDVQLYRSLGDLEATVGGQVRGYLPRSDGTYLADVDEDITATEVGGYGQLDYPLFDERLRLVGAGRIDHHSDYGSQLSPSATAVYAVAPSQNVRVGYQRAFKSPTILESHLLLNDVLVGNSTGFEIRDADGNTLATVDPLEPERVSSIEVGYKGVFGTQLFVDATAYNSWYTNFISPLSRVANPADPVMPTFGYYPDGTLVADGTPAAGTLFTYANFGEATVRGFDLGATYLPIDQIELSASGSYIDLASFSSGDSPQQELLLNVPTVKLKGAITVSGLVLDSSYVRLGGRWHNAFDFESGYWSSARFGEVPASFLADVGAGYTFPGAGISVSASVSNVFDNHDPDVLGVPVPRRFAFLQVAYAFSGLAY
jgi:outer membrane receptor for ferrienterochelin and colicins